MSSELDEFWKALEERAETSDAYDAIIVRLTQLAASQQLRAVQPTRQESRPA
jgi:hypothetical protein